MALKGNFKNPFKQNEIINEAYLKIVYLVDDVLGGGCNFVANVYFSDEDRDGDNPADPIKVFDYSVKGEEYTTFFSEDVLKQENKSSRTQAYAYLKTLPEFEGWENA